MKTRAQVCCFGRVNRSAELWQHLPTTRIGGHLTRFNLHFVEIGAQVREHERTQRDDGDGRRSAGDRRWKRLDERFGLGASKDTVGGRARAKVPRLDLLMKPLRPAGPPANRDVAGAGARGEEAWKPTPNLKWVRISPVKRSAECA